MCFGQSAGGASALAMYASPLNKNYIKRLSLQSSVGLNSLVKETTMRQIQEKSIKFVVECGCKNIEEMRQLDANFLRDKNDEMFGMFDGFSINIDGHILIDYPIKSLINSKSNDLDIIIGCTADEGANDKEPMFGINLCANIVALCKKSLESNLSPLYAYVFSCKQPGDDVGVPHSCDNRYQFNTLDGSWRPYTNNDYELARKMNKYWSNFAKTGNPNSNNLNKWLPYNKENPQQMKFDIDECKMFDFNIDTNGNIEKESNKLLEEYGR